VQRPLQRLSDSQTSCRTTQLLHNVFLICLDSVICHRSTTTAIRSHFSTWWWCGGSRQRKRTSGGGLPGPASCRRCCGSGLCLRSTHVIVPRQQDAAPKSDVEGRPCADESAVTNDSSSPRLTPGTRHARDDKEIIRLNCYKGTMASSGRAVSKRPRWLREA
jgi:hypothetical protein